MELHFPLKGHILLWLGMMFWKYCSMRSIKTRSWVVWKSLNDLQFRVLSVVSKLGDFVIERFCGPELNLPGCVSLHSHEAIFKSPFLFPMFLVPSLRMCSIDP